MTEINATSGLVASCGTVGRTINAPAVHLTGPGDLERAASMLRAEGYRIADPDAWLFGCDAVVVMPGCWDSSTVAGDLALCRAFGLPVFELLERPASLGFDLAPLDTDDQMALIEAH